MSPASSTSPKKEPFSFRIFQSLFLLSIVMLPFFRGAANLWYFSFCVLLLCAAFSFHWFTRAVREPILYSVLDPWVALYALCFLVSLAFSRVPYLSWIEGFKLLCVICAFAAARYVCRGRPQIYGFVQAMAILGGLLSMLGLLQFTGGVTRDWWNHPHFLSSTYTNHNHFAGLLNLLLPISLGLVLAERSGSKKVLYLFLCGLMGCAMALTLSRGGLISFGVSMVFMVVFLKKKGLISASILPLVLFLGLALGAVLIFGTSSIEQRIENIQRMTLDEEMSLKVRQFVWQGTLPMIRNYFWLGSGPGTFGHLFLRFRPAEFFFQRSEYALNDFLQLWAECGVFAFLAAGCLVLVLFWRGIHILHLDDSRLRIGVGSGILAGQLGLLVHGFFNFNFHIPANWLLSAATAGLLLAMDDRSFYSKRITTTAVRILVSLALVVAPAAALYLSTTDYRLWEARQLFQEGDRRSGLEAVEKSITLNPWNPESYYLRGLIRAKSDPAYAVKDFDEAIKLNRYEPVYDMAKARALVPALAESSPAELTALFKNALDKDPNNREFIAILVREAFGRSHERFGRFREEVGRLLEKDSKTLEGLVLSLEGQDLWQYHRQYNLKLLGLNPNAVKGDVSAGLWNRFPSSAYTLKEFSNGEKTPVHTGDFFYRNGELTKKLKIHKPLVRLVLRAKGEPVKGVFPTLYVKMNDKIMDECYVDSRAYKNYYTDLKLPAGEHTLSIQYVNDRSVGNPSEDRNVWIQKIYILEL